jgi:hypothetical protein
MISPRHHSAKTPPHLCGMKSLLIPILALLLASCQVYAGGGTLVSDGRTTTVRTSEVEAGTDRPPQVRSRRVVVEE